METRLCRAAAADLPAVFECFRGPSCEHHRGGKESYRTPAADMEEPRFTCQVLNLLPTSLIWMLLMGRTRRLVCVSSKPKNISKFQRAGDNKRACDRHSRSKPGKTRVRAESSDRSRFIPGDLLEPSLPVSLLAHQAYRHWCLNVGADTENKPQENRSILVRGGAGRRGKHWFWRSNLRRTSGPFKQSWTDLDCNNSNSSLRQKITAATHNILV